MTNIDKLINFHVNAAMISFTISQVVNEFAQAQANEPANV